MQKKIENESIEREGLYRNKFYFFFKKKIQLLYWSTHLDLLLKSQVPKLSFIYYQIKKYWCLLGPEQGGEPKI